MREKEVTIITKLDYSLTSSEERLALVNKILEEVPNPSSAYLETLANYLIIPIEKEERRERKILTENRMVTLNKNEISFDGLVSQLENGEDGIYNLMNESKTTILHPKTKITKKDLEDIPELRSLQDTIATLEEQLKTSSGRDTFILKNTIIELRKDQYVIKNSYKQPVGSSRIGQPNFSPKLYESFELDENGYVVPHGYSLCDPKVCSAILCNYSKLKQGSAGRFESDLYYLLDSFDHVRQVALEQYPLYDKIVEYKIQGLQNNDIQEQIKKEFGIVHTTEYISSLWRNKIPKLIASAAEDQLLDWYYLNVEKGKYKRCSRCGQIKLAHNKYFSKNQTSKDGYYSICKECRNKPRKKEE